CRNRSDLIAFLIDLYLTQNHIAGIAPGTGHTYKFLLPSTPLLPNRLPSMLTTRVFVIWARP
ncbi:MAG: hypothetical protein QM668_18045, partial [Agriterribacter sp.]